LCFTTHVLLWTLLFPCVSLFMCYFELCYSCVPLCFAPPLCFVATILLQTSLLMCFMCFVTFMRC
jgi:hypothetical protein